MLEYGTWFAMDADQISRFCNTAAEDGWRMVTATFDPTFSWGAKEPDGRWILIFEREVPKELPKTFDVPEPDP